VRLRERTRDYVRKDEDYVRVDWRLRETVSEDQRLRDRGLRLCEIGLETT